MTAIADSVVIGYGSESGNARSLAQTLGAHPSLQAFSPRVMPLSDVTAEMLAGPAPLIILSASFGDGDPPSNAEAFLNLVTQTPSLASLRYAIFGLGDTGYPNFCGFTKQLDATLQQKQATALINRVDADYHFRDFFTLWLPVLEQVLNGDAEAGSRLTLQVKAYGESHAFAAPVLERHRLNGSDPAAWHIRLDASDSGMIWRAGDTLTVIPENDPQLLEALARWYGDAGAVEALRDRELRLISKSILRELSRLCDSDELKELLKFKQRKALEAYLWQADLLDLLQDFATPEKVPLAELKALLSPVLGRSYSIASPGGVSHIDLCVRVVSYEHASRLHLGTASHWLTQTEGPVRIYCRSNPGFHLPADSSVPLILVGTGTGIAPLIGLLRELEARGQRRDTCLIFGEKHREQDFLYENELTALQQSGALGSLHAAFSRDGASKYYVQHAIVDHGSQLRDMLERGAHVYVCGNKAHLEDAVSGAMAQIMGDAGEAAPADDAFWQELQAQGRVHLELY